MIPRPVGFLPAQTPLFEQGGLAGLPLANAVISTAWFDTYQVLDGEIQIPQTGLTVDSGSEAITGTGTTAQIGAYYLDLYADHNNANGAPLTIDIRGAIAQALEVGGPPVLLLRRFIVQPSELGSGEVRPFMSTARITARFFQVRYVYPGFNATRFSTALTMRAF